MKIKLTKKVSDASSTQSHSSISSSISEKARSIKKAVAKGAKALARPLKKVKKSFSSQSVRSRPTDTVDLTRSSTNSLDSDDDEATAGAFDPNPDPAANLGVFLSIDSCKYLIRQRCRGSQEDLAVTYL